MILVKLITSLAFSGLLYFYLAGLFMLIAGCVAKKNVEITQHMVLGSLCAGILFFEYLA